VTPSVHNPKYNHPTRYDLGAQTDLENRLQSGLKSSGTQSPSPIARKVKFDRLDLYLPPPWTSGRRTKMTRVMSLQTYHGECELSSLASGSKADEKESTFNFNLSHLRILSVYPKLRFRRPTYITRMSRTSGVRPRRVLWILEW
jgi:hypothetical protein